LTLALHIVITLPCRHYATAAYLAAMPSRRHEALMNISAPTRHAVISFNIFQPLSLRRRAYAAAVICLRHYAAILVAIHDCRH